jgi:hypothetical protein
MKPISKGFKTDYYIYMSPHKTANAFKITMNHELIHVYHFNHYDRDGRYASDSEYVTTAYTQRFYPGIINSIPPGRIPLDFLPPYLITIPR